MKLIPFSQSLIVQAALATLLAGCATGQAQQLQTHHPGTAAMDKTARSASGMPMMGADMASMCEMHEEMMNATTPEERRARMADHMKSMPPDMMKMHMAMMHEHMQMMQEHMGTQTPNK